MPTLKEYLGGLFDSLSQARVAADLHTLSIAEQYAQHELLRHFAVPRMRFSDVVLDVPVAIEGLNQRTEYQLAPTGNDAFRTSIYELSVTGVFDLIENRQSYLRRPDFVPYLFVGVGGFYFNPKAQAPADFGGPGTWVALQPLRTEGVSYSLIQVNVPFGVGFRYKASPRWDISFEIGYRFLFTDYLDDVSGNYADPSTLPSPLARAMANRTTEINSASGNFRDLNRVLNDIGYSVITKRAADGSLYRTVNGYEAAEKRGSPNEKDWYLVTGFHFNYILVKGVRCPKFR